ncbi:MAG TPA: S9 family peptidase [Terracidiphilus sp.]|jgi:dipeptidyl aminopeptidase/acylaminoacyl peptidase
MRNYILLALLLAATFASAQTARGPQGQVQVPGVVKRPMTFEDMMHMKRLGSTAVSADGKWLGYSVTTVDLDKNTKTPELWLQAIAGGEPIKLAVGQAGDDGLQFAPDGHSVLFLSGREQGQQIWVADFDGSSGATSNAKKLTSLSTGADNAKWAPDSKSIVFTSDVYPDCPAISPADGGASNKCNADRDKAKADSKVKAQIFTHLLYRHWNHFTGDKRSHLFQVLVDGSGLRDLVPNNPHDVPTDYPTDPLGCGCAFSPDSKELAITYKDVPDEAVSTNSDIFTLDLTDPNAKPVKVSTSPGGDMSPAYSPDGRYLAWRSQARAGYESDRFRLMLYDRAAKTTKDLLPQLENWVDEFAWAPDAKQVYFVSNFEGTSPIYLANLDGAVQIIYRSGTTSDLHPLPDMEAIVFIRNTVWRPSEVVSISTALPPQEYEKLIKMGYRLGGGRIAAGPVVKYEEKQVTNLNGELLSQLQVAPIKDFWFSASDGIKIQGFLIKPPAFDSNKKYPVKFLIHGGPQGAWGDSWSYRWNAELFAANGYVVIMINPGGSTGYGQAFVDRVNGDWGGKPYTDLMTGLTYAEQHYPFIDKTRECALGASYGGYMANWVLGHTNRFKCIVSHDGMFDAESAFGSTEEDWFNTWEFKGSPWDYYGKPDSENPFRKWSPSLSAKNFKTPTLVVHSQLDYRLDVSEGYQLFDTLQMLHVPSKMLYFPDEGHWVLKPQNSQLWWKTVNDWVDQWTKTRGNRD